MDGEYGLCLSWLQRLELGFGKLPAGLSLAATTEAFLQLQQPGTHRDLQLPEHWLLPPRGQESRLVDGWRGWQRVAVRIRIYL